MRLTMVGAALAVIMFSLGASAAFARSAPSATPAGNDVSYPQCGRSLPSGQAFGIVGVNDGLANNSNPCVTSEISWALKSTGATSQPKASLYVNTANPGNLGVEDWPKNDTDPVTGLTDNNPYGTCTGSDTSACAWQYGWNAAALDAQRRGVSNPSSYSWWLDVETGNSWESNTTNNRADLEGMVAYFTSISATAGIYSTSYQWGQIAGIVPSTSSLSSLRDWIPGARTLSGAKSNCSSQPLTAGGIVSVTQWTASIDGDYSCR